MKIDNELHPQNFLQKLEKFWSLSGEKIRLIEKEYDSGRDLRYLLWRGNIPLVAGPNGPRVFSLVPRSCNLMLLERNTF